MNPTSTNLFEAESLDKHIAGRLSQVERAISEAELDDMSTDFESSIVQKHSIKAVSLARQEAVFEPDDTTQGIRVRVTIPFTGSAYLLYCSPGREAGQRPYATVEDGRWNRSPKASLTLSSEFDADASQDEIRSWARQEVDQIESILALQKPVIETYNEELPGKVAEIANLRRTALTNVADLRDGLQQGI